MTATLRRATRMYVCLRERKPVSALVQIVASLALACADAFLGIVALIGLCMFFMPPLTLVALVLMGPWFSLLRMNADASRRLLVWQTGEPVPAHYRALARHENPFAGILRLRDSMVLRDNAWLWINGTLGLCLLFFPFLILVLDVHGAILILQNIFALLSGRSGFTVSFVWLCFWDAVGIVALLFAAPLFLSAYQHIARATLTGGHRTRLKRRLQELQSSRQQVNAFQAAEIRRIERDLHDGAQAQLVATGMTLATAQALLDHDPEQARQLLDAAKKSTSQALADMRSVVRGIYPPVLADRGLVEALRAAAAQTPMTTTVTSDLVGDLYAPLEAALYFAATEAVTNAVKHSGADRITVTLKADETRGELMLTVFDNGHGGAEESRGTGLRGIRTRMSAFDARVAVDSPAAGPTVVAVAAPLIRSENVC